MAGKASAVFVRDTKCWYNHTILLRKIDSFPFVNIFPYGQTLTLSKAVHLPTSPLIQLVLPVHQTAPVFLIIAASTQHHHRQQPLKW
jgi:hypothetical protein